MKSSLILLVIWPLVGIAQFSDNFSDGDFTNNPTWTGDAAKLEVDGSFRLHLNAPAVADVAYLSTPSGVISNAEWSP